MAPVTQHHAPCPVLNGLLEFGVVAGAVLAAHAVALDIGFVHHIEAQLVAKLIEYLGVGVVARTNGVDIGAFHHVEILIISLAGHCPAVVGVKVMPVDALDNDALAVDEQHVAFYLYLFEADADALRAECFSAAFEGNYELVEIRLLGRPALDVLLDVGESEHGLAARCGHFLRADLFHLAADAERGFDGAFGGRGVIAERHFKPESAVCVALVEGGVRKDIADAELLLAVNIYIAVDAGEEPHILILEVGAVRVAEYLDGYLIFAGLNVFGNVEFRGGHRAL